MRALLYWGSYLLLPALVLLATVIRHRAISPWLAGPLVVALCAGAYARFIEPQRLTVRTHDVTICGDGLPGTLTAAVASDPQIGVFRHAVDMRRIASRLRAIDPDFVLIPGDFTYYATPAQIARAFTPLETLSMPIYATLGNHDLGIPHGEDVSVPLKSALASAGVRVLHPGTAVFEKSGKFVRIVGIEDYEFLEETGGAVTPLQNGAGMPIIALQHNPTLAKDPRFGGYDLMVSGHTHGGQVLTPFTCAVTEACDTLRLGYADTPVGKLFVSAGTGMSALPIRFGVPPRIDVLNLTLDRCRPTITDKPV